MIVVNVGDRYGKGGTEAVATEVPHVVRELVARDSNRNSGHIDNAGSTRLLI